MNRRVALSSMAASAAAICFPAQAQPGRKIHRIGFVTYTQSNADLAARPRTDPGELLVEAGLRELGWVEGRNIELLWKSTEGRTELEPGIIDEFVRIPVDVLVVFNNRAAAVAVTKTTTIPVVMVGGFVIEQGLVASLARPGGNLTGLSWEHTSYQGKLLHLLKSAAPRVSKIAFLGRVAHGDFLPETLAAAADLRLTIFHVRYEGVEFDRAITEAVRQGANALVFLGTPQLLYRQHQQRAHELSARHGLPDMHETLAAVESGALMAYDASADEAYRRVPYFIHRILKGAKPADLPMEQCGKIELHLNLGTARTLGLTFPPTLLTQADRVFE